MSQFSTDETRLSTGYFVQPVHAFEDHHNQEEYGFEVDCSDSGDSDSIAYQLGGPRRSK